MALDHCVWLRAYPMIQSFTITKQLIAKNASLLTCLLILGEEICQVFAQRCVLLCSLFCPFGVKKTKHFATVIGPFDLWVSGCNAIRVRVQSNLLMSEGAPAKQRGRACTLSCWLWMTGIYTGSKSVNQTIVTPVPFTQDERFVNRLREDVDSLLNSTHKKY